MLALRTHLSPGLCLHVRQPIASRLGVVPVVLAGKTGVGKTALLLRICENKFSATVPTTGVESGVITVAVPGGLVKSRIWDTGMHRRAVVCTALVPRHSPSALRSLPQPDKNGTVPSL